MTTTELDELPLIEGQHVRVLQVQDDGWWLGYAADAPERVGLFPSNYVRQVAEQRPQQVRRPPSARLDISEDDDEDERKVAPVQHTRALEQRGDSDEDDYAEDDDYERQQHERRTRQRIQQTQQHRRHHRDVRAPGDGDDETDEEEGGAVAASAQQQRKVSVLQLKRSLADAERASVAARAARLQAEHEHATPRFAPLTRRHQPRDIRDAGNKDDDEDDEDDSVFEFSERRRRPRRDVSDGGDGDGDDDEEETEDGDGDEAFSRSRSHLHRQIDSADVHEYTKSEGDEQDDAMDQSIDRALQEQQRRHASRVIAHSLERNLRSKQQQRSFQARQHAAALAIQRWMVRTSSQQRGRSAVLRRQQEQDDGVMQRREAAAAVRIQVWIRQLFVYFRWQARVERERVAMLKAKRLAALQREQERMREEAEAQRQRQERAREEEEAQQQRRTQQQRQSHDAPSPSENRDEDALSPPEPLLSALHTAKSQRKVMKKDAVALVKTLVKQQLDEKLREHDEKMSELQRLVTTLQDVIRKQNAMLLDSTGDVSVTTILTTKAASSVGQAPALPPSPSVVSSASLIPKPPSRSALPQLAGGNSSAAATKPSGIKPPRASDIPSRLPMLHNTRSSHTSKR